MFWNLEFTEYADDRQPYYFLLISLYSFQAVTFDERIVLRGDTHFTSSVVVNNHLEVIGNITNDRNLTVNTAATLTADCI